MAEPIVLVIGLGEIGMPLFELIKKAYPKACGIDIKPAAITESVDYMHICYPYTPTNDFIEATEKYAKKYKPKTIIIHSTVVPGTTKNIALRTKIPTIYSPVRGKHSNMAADLLHYHKFVAGTDDEAVSKIASHFKKVGLKTTILSAPESLELAKLVETTYFGLLIAFAQNIERFAKACGADYNELHKFFGEVGYLPKHQFTPGYIGGHCIMPNIELLNSCFKSEILEAIKTSNEIKGIELGQAAINREHGKNRTRVTPVKIEHS
ncbi:MAG: hypothetical protein JW841_02695 [Deltaproteobacteria bacterium]|nr:hypothetical protein [Deltaproteobacteria bacterium]